MSMSSIYDRWDDTRFLRYNVGDARYMYPGNEGEETHVWYQWKFNTVGVRVQKESGEQFPTLLDELAGKDASKIVARREKGEGSILLT